MSASIVRLPGAGMKLLARDQRLLDRLTGIELRLDATIAAITQLRGEDAHALALVANMEVAELITDVMGGSA